MIKRIMPLLIVAAGFGLAFLIIITGPKLDPHPNPQLPPLVNVIKAAPEDVALSTFTHGTVAPRTESNLVPEVSGSINEISSAMVSGGFFKKGDTLVEIDPLDYQVALQRAQSGMARASSDLDNARRAHRRQLDLAKKQSTSASQKDDAFNRLSIAEATFDEARANLSRAKRDLERTHMIAPYDGRVRSEQIDVGQFITRGSPIAVIYATDSVEIKLPIHDEELAYLSLSLRENSPSSSVPTLVTLRARFAGENRQWSGKIVRTEGELDSQTHMVNIVASVSSPYDPNVHDIPLSVGLFVEAEIHGTINEGVVVLPRSALRNDDEVYIINRENKLIIKDVEVLRIANDKIYISSGLSDQDQVVTSPLDNAVSGMSVRTNFGSKSS